MGFSAKVDGVFELPRGGVVISAVREDGDSDFGVGDTLRLVGIEGRTTLIQVRDVEMLAIPMRGREQEFKESRAKRIRLFATDSVRKEEVRPGEQWVQRLDYQQPASPGS